MNQPITIDLDLAKNVFQVHRVEASGIIVCHRKLRLSQVLVCFARLEPCLIDMETSAAAHHGARGLAILARLM